MDPENNTKALHSIICAIIILFLVIYAILDFTVTQPKIRHNVKEVAVQFDSMKTYLDGKLPQIDSALIIHRSQIKEQTIRLKELNKVSSILIQN